MAYTSASSVQKSFKYDVFLSFRGEDNRDNFVDHLFHALQQKDITTYKDDEKIEKGERISDQLIRSIEDSRFHIIVFSNNYASSSGCLDELVKIMECQKTTEQTAYPIFYDVEPTQVRQHKGPVGKAFAKHVNNESAGKWRDAMKDVADLAAWVMKTSYMHDTKVIQEIVGYISLELRSLNPSLDVKLVGMKTRVNKIVSLLEIGFDKISMIGIKGTGGSGKTTLVRAVFDYISTQFECKSFVENVREVSKRSRSGLQKLQKQVLKDVSNDESIDVTSVIDGKHMMEKVMFRRKILLVLDDVDSIEQLEALAGSPNWFKPGSRIIITTRDERVLKAHGVNCIHDVNLLSDEEAICLFSRHAFGGEYPDQFYEELSKKVVRYVAGLPLTIKVLGSHLFGRTKIEWLDVIEKLETIPLIQTLNIIELSYHDLENDHKEIFLDVACILKGEMEKKANKILESYGLNAQIGLRVLKQRSLITISRTNGLGMHDHIAEMGKNIVRRLHHNNRLWVAEEIEDILVNDVGTKETRSIKLEYPFLHPATIMKGLRKMKELGYLYVYDEGIALESGQVDQYLPNSLKYLHWSYYPFRCLPTTFEANNLVNLEMPQSNISQLWKWGYKKVLTQLIYLNLRGSKLRDLDLWKAPCLEEIHLEECNEFEYLYLPYELLKLRYLNLRGSKLRHLDLSKAPCLEELHLEECNEFEYLNIYAGCPKLKYLDLSGSKLSNLNLELAPNLETLNLSRCKNFVELHMPVHCLMLKSLNLSGSKLSYFNLELTPHLEKFESTEMLFLSQKDIKYLSNGICMLKDLKSLELKSCLLLKHLPEDLGNLECLEKLHISDCTSLLDIPDSICNMKCLIHLHLPYCVRLKILPKDIGLLKCLKELNIEGTAITDLPQSITDLKGQLCIVWSRGRLEMNGFTSIKKLSKYTASCYI